MKGALLGAALGLAVASASAGRAEAARDATPPPMGATRDDPAQIVAGAMLAIDELEIDPVSRARLARAHAVLIMPGPSFGCAGAGQGLLVTDGAKQWGAPLFVTAAKQPSCSSGNLVIMLGSAASAEDLITTHHLPLGAEYWTNDPKDTPVPQAFEIDDVANRSFYGEAATPGIILAGRVSAPDSVAQLTAAFGG